MTVGVHAMSGAARRMTRATLETMDDIALEKALFDAKTAYFENVFSIKPVIKEKRVYG